MTVINYYCALMYFSTMYVYCCNNMYLCRCASPARAFFSYSGRSVRPRQEFSILDAVVIMKVTRRSIAYAPISLISFVVFLFIFSDQG
ncbi:hypothetical protein BDB00DRAFT_178311 [Zychaea mexicana]|uniref:uncharacterized protein n=1 Tax=Zychaea mexicana TaxID=64656 RepID=UPI0022FE3FDA|nr:uncharacterized protein BDB00DRAFT_178311 [Zychaea mexicana]KAI9495946.1 hypothetical protein BDB00DRAFT_178311 [Zychaea mexicana]